MSYAYDGELMTSITWTGDVVGTLGFSHNADFRVAAESVNGTGTMAYSYDDDGLLTGAGGLELTRHADHGRVASSTTASSLPSRTPSALSTSSLSWPLTAMGERSPGEGAAAPPFGERVFLSSMRRPSAGQGGGDAARVIDAPGAGGHGAATAMTSKGGRRAWTEAPRGPRRARGARVG